MRDPVTIGLYQNTVTAGFTTNDCLVDVYNGYSVSFVLTDATADFSMEIYIEASACSNGNFAKLTGTSLHFAGNDTIVYNVSQVYYKYFRVVCTLNSGTCDLLIEVTRKN